MPGAWEYIRPNVFVSILTRGIVPTKWAMEFRQMELPPGSTITFLGGLTFDHARNSSVDAMLERGFQWLFFLDDDVIPPHDVINRLIGRGQDIISGLYWRRPKPLMPVMLADTNPTTFITDYQPGSLIQADLVGAGCLLIHRRVLEAIKKPWFEWKMYNAPEGERCSEDFDFCRKARKAGFKIAVDTSIACAHAGYSQSINGTMEPLDL